MDNTTLAAVFISACMLGGISASIAARRGIRRMEGFAYGFVLGPIGIIIACILPAGARPIAASVDDNAERIRRGKEAAASLALRAKLERLDDSGKPRA